MRLFKLKAVIIYGLFLLPHFIWAEPATPSVVPLSEDPETSLDRLQTMVNQQQWGTARLWAQELEEDFLGVEAFDVLYAQLLIQESDYANAVFALERVLLVNPQHLIARAELGRVYYFQGQFQRATDQLKLLLSVDLPSAVRKEIQQVLADIEQAQRRYEINNTIGVTISAGWQENTELPWLSAEGATPERLSFGHTRWSVHYALIEPVNQTSSRRLLSEYAYLRQSDSRLENTHQLTLGALVNYRTASQLTRWPIALGAQWSDSSLLSTHLGTELTWQRMPWESVWFGPNLVIDTNLYNESGVFIQSEAGLGLTLTISEQARAHEFTLSYHYFLQAGQSVPNYEWHGVVNRWQTLWPITKTLQWNQVLDYQWRQWVGLETILSSTTPEPSEIARADQHITLNSTLSWSPVQWLQSDSSLKLIWNNSNITGFDRQSWSVDQSIQFKF